MRAGSVEDGPPSVNMRPRHFCWRGPPSPLPFRSVSNPRDKSANRRLLADVNHPRFSLFDDSGTRERQSALAGRIAEYTIITLVVIVIAGMEIGRWAFNTPPQPLLFSFVALCLATYAALRVALIWRQVSVLRREEQARHNLRLAIDEVCARGWLFFDGLMDPRGHLLGSVLAGPGGLFTLVPRFIARGRNLSEKVRRRESDMLMIGSHAVLADPIGQAREAARSLYEVLAADGIDTVAVQPAVVFPGWTIAPQLEEDESGVWILSDSDLVSRLTQAPAVMEAKDLIAVSLLFERLARG